MYRKPRFLEELHAIREEMSRDCDYDVDLFVEMVRSGRGPNDQAPSDQASGKHVPAREVPVDHIESQRTEQPLTRNRPASIPEPATKPSPKPAVSSIPEPDMDTSQIQPANGLNDAALGTSRNRRMVSIPGVSAPARESSFSEPKLNDDDNESNIPSNH